MTGPEILKAIIEQYAGHGWTLRRALLSSEPRPEEAAELRDAELVEADQDALWFSRRSLPDAEAWELRRLTGPPFALVAVIPDAAEEDEKEGMLAEIEERMLHARPPASGH